MGRTAVELSPLVVARITEPGLHFVGGVPGLALQVLPGGGRTWILRATMLGGRRRDMGLGGFPGVTLADAKEAARAARKLIRENIDPIDHAAEEKRKAEKERLDRLAAEKAKMTFKAAALAYIADKEDEWRNPKHIAQWTSTLTTYAFPVIGDLAVEDVELRHVLDVLRPIWKGKTETASRLRGRIERVLSWAMSRDYRPQGLNPARWRGHLDNMLAAPSKAKTTKHHAAVPVAEMGDFMKRLRASKGMGAKALEFAILTAARSGEVRGATWAEIDLGAKTWTVPASRMKAGREHRVPLSDAAVTLLEALPHGTPSDIVFPAARGGELSDMTLSAVTRRMDVDAVPHGFRSTFRDWAAERANTPHEICEMALAHTIANKAEAAYRRGDLFEKRRKLMAQWATFCSLPSTHSASVTPIGLRA